MKSPRRLFRSIRPILSAGTFLLLIHCCAKPLFGAEWEPAKGPLMTRWAKDVSPDKVHPEYPRPQLVRTEWQNLNGLWDYAIQPKADSKPAQFEGQILVPFPIESALSGVMKKVGEENRLWYRRTFDVPESWSGKRILLHFGGVDWESTVYVNGKEMGVHRGGYDAFSFDITDALTPTGGQEVVVAVFDPTDSGPQPRGKQVKEPKGIWYTSVTGIWQTPWLEPVASTSIESIKIDSFPDLRGIELNVTLRGTTEETTLFCVLSDGNQTVARVNARVGNRIRLNIPAPKLWSPESPHLYDLKVSVVKRLDGRREVVDEIVSYAGVRKISTLRDPDGFLRLLLNNMPLFQYGPLDQGWWPDGLYTAPTDEALRYDIEVTKKLGFNMARKHVKVEPARWYYWCDKLGLLVWQDMPSGDKSARWRGPSGYDGEEMQRTPESAALFERELRALLGGLHNHPSIVTWVPFNEGWGQFDTVRILNLTKQLDPTRLVDGPSGGNHFPAGDMIDHHQYPGPGAPERVTDRVMILGEFGGLGLPLPGHTWQAEKNWGYRSFENAEALTEAYLNLLTPLHRMIGSHGLAAAIYTQTMDVEVEVNGLMPYDRSSIKMDEARVLAANLRLYEPPPLTVVLLPTSQRTRSEWKYTTTQPADNWFTPEFNDSNWPKGLGGFGEPTTPGSTVRTDWKTPDIWIRRSFELAEGQEYQNPTLWLHHDEDAEVYINGTLAAKVQGFTGSYVDVELTAEAIRALKSGSNVIAIHCHQTEGGQYIDAGLVDYREPEPGPVRSQRRLQTPDRSPRP